jgi:hypothetical protein
VPRTMKEMMMCVAEVLTDHMCCVRGGVGESRTNGALAEEYSLGARGYVSSR